MLYVAKQYLVHVLTFTITNFELGVVNYGFILGFTWQGLFYMHNF